ncbi:EVE domain-containing protein [Spirosoma harenae]
MSEPPKYWVVVASKDHVMRGVSGGFMQVNHGKEAPLKRLKPHDWVVFYSPKKVLEEDEKLQAFTAIGQVSDDNIYQQAMTETFTPFRRNVTFYDAKDIPIQPLIPKLDFIQNKKSWGYTFRFGFFEIDKKDFDLIHNLMLSHDKSS